jgi:hypothetical protein
VSEKRQRGVVVSVRFNGDEFLDVASAAERDGSTLSAFLRGHALWAAAVSRPGARVVTDARTGVQIAFWCNLPGVLAVS